MRLEGPTLAHVIAHSRNNNFTALRLIAALVVVWFHQTLLSGSLNPEPISTFISWEGSGHAAVDIFFLISGILVSQSFDRHTFPSSWAALRIARIWPGLIVVTILVNFIVAALNAKVSWWEFVTYPETRRCLYENMKLVLGACKHHSLAFPGVAAPFATNFPLWSLPVEVHCYIFLLVIGLLGAFRSKLVGTVLIVAGTTAFLFVKLFAPPMGSLAFQNDFVGQGGMTLVPPLFFFLGILLYMFRERIIVDWRLAIALMVAYLIARKTPLDAPLFYAALVYGSLAVAASTTLNRVWAFNPDFSYGIYIYHFPIMQLVAYRLPDLPFAASFPLVIASSFCAAALSWYLIEKPSLDGVRHVLPILEAQIRSRFLSNERMASAASRVRGLFVAK